VRFRSVPYEARPASHIGRTVEIPTRPIGISVDGDDVA